MKFMNKNKKRISFILAVITVLTLCIGVMAYFTDREVASASAVSAEVSDIIKVTTKDDGTESTDPEGPGGDLEKKWAKTNEDLIGDAALVRPGDVYDLSYKLTNLGDKIFVRETIKLTVVDYQDNAKNLDADAPEWRLFSAYGQDEYGAKAGTTVVKTESVSGNQITYSIEPTVLEKDAAVNKTYYTILDKYVGNEWQNSECTVEYLVEMAQWAEGIELDGPNADWTPICTSTITFGGDSAYKAVPKANG